MKLIEKFQITLIVFILASMICFHFWQEIFNILLFQVNKILDKNLSVYIMEITEIYLVAIKISTYFGLIIAQPFFVYKLFSILKKKYSASILHYVPYIALMHFFGFCGLVFCYYIVIPISLNFLIDFAQDFSLSIDMVKFLGFCTRLFAIFNLIFSLPILCILAVKEEILEFDSLKKFWKLAILIMFFIVTTQFYYLHHYTQLIIFIGLLINWCFALVLAKLYVKKIVQIYEMNFKLRF
ncbi:MAG: twin-arginine translocase subunit TatC [Campylobacter sp.]|nr:twin-arginine translocase subunit TatC [Campylobacter sp.]MBQ7675058.1 twin-arginine translocase subunit TatC [Campylobacter sp.]MBR0070911.1 twin-arginine translocase subunit TatC [Campylobacter sp.]